MVVYDSASGEAMGLSNHHVFVGATGQAADNITQPGTKASNDVVGTLTRWSEPLDCALGDVGLRDEPTVSPAGRLDAWDPPS